MKIHALFLSTILVSVSSCGGGNDSNEPAPAPIPSSTSSSAKSEISSVSTTTSSAIASSLSSKSSESSSSTSVVAVTCTTQECESQNKDLVQKIYTDVMNGGKVDLISSYFDTNLTLHMPGSNNGPSGETSHLQSLKNNNPNYVATVKHIAAEGDYVAVHWHLSSKPDNEFNGKAVVDLYKLSGHKIIEHWHLSANLSDTTASGNSLFSDLYKYTGTKPVATQESEAANKQLVTTTYLGLFNDKNLDLIDQNIAPTYLQHNPYVPNGSKALRDFVSPRTPGGLVFFATISDDDLVWTFSGDGNLALVDMFRVDNKKIVEHYDLF